MNIDFYSNNSEECKIVENKLKECGISYRKHNTGEGNDIDIAPTIYCGGFFYGLNTIAPYFFKAWEERKSKNSFEGKLSN